MAAKSTIAQKYLDAFSQGKCVRRFLRQGFATWHEEKGTTIVSWSDGSCIYVHSGKTKPIEASSIEAAKQKALESVGDTEGLHS